MIPRSLGISSPEGKDVFEFFIIVKSRPSVLGKISELFGRNNVDMLGVHGQVSDDRSKGFIIIYAEMSDSKVKAEELSKILRENEYVIDVIYEQKKNNFFESVLFPLTSGGHYRVFAIGVLEWIKLVRSLYERFGSAAASLLYDQGVNVGKGMVERITRRFDSRPSNDLLTENFKLLFRAAGLGIIDLNYEGGNISCRVAYPAIKGEEGAVDYFSIGIISGALSAINGLDYFVKNVSFEDNTLIFSLVKSDEKAK